MDKNLNTSKMDFDDMNKSGCYTQNTHLNKTIRATERTAILMGLLQLFDNMSCAIRQLNAYDASSIIIGEANWLKRNHFSKYTPSEDAVKKVGFGDVCVIDYGKTYKGEIGYIHPGLCIGKKCNKYLVIPMTTGKSWRNKCYHPEYNPNKPKDTRQSYIEEGFSQDGVLLIHDTKFISGGRILDVNEHITLDVLLDIQNQVMEIMFPLQYKSMVKTNRNLLNKNEKLLKKISNQNGQIKNLKNKCEELSTKISTLESKSDEKVE